jgi:SH3-like domain-containing protein
LLHDTLLRLKRGLGLAGFLLLLGFALLPVGSAGAAEFRSVGDAGAIFFDAPSAQARKLFIAKRYYPVAIAVNLEQWCKVRDVAGDLAWVEKRALSDQRMVMVTAPWAQVRAAPDPGASPVFAVEKDVALEVLEITSPDWVRVKHIDGQSGFIRTSEVWGL